MGTRTPPDYDKLECRARQDETEDGSVKHNGLMGRKAERPRPLHPQATDPTAIMANDLQNLETDSDASAASAAGNKLNLDFGIAIEEKPLWVELYQSLRDVFFPPKLPPLELTSTPIPVPDRMAVKPNPWAIGISTSVNIAILVVLLFFVGKHIIETVNPNLLTATDIDVGQFKAPKAANLAGGGGGGGDHSIADPIKGKLPKIEKNPITPPQVQTVDKPKLAMEAAIDVQKSITLPDNPNLPNIGMKHSANVKLASNGQGGGSGMGTGYGGGLGSGTGNGYGPGSGGNTGGGVYRVGGGISAPVPIYDPEPEFSDEARRAKYQGVVLVGLIVDAQGNPQNVHIVRALGMGLDEKALEAVRTYKFKPSLKDGKTPVPVYVTIEVNFHLY